MKTKVMVLADYYSPGFKAGGAVRSLSNIMGRLGDRLDFSIVTRNHDLGDPEPYPSLAADTWLEMGDASVHYASRSPWLFWKVRTAMRAKAYDALYLNSFFSPAFTIFPLLFRRLGLLRASQVVLAPRGELTLGALQIKAMKKKLFLLAGKALGLYRDILFQASSPMEVADIRRVLGVGTRVEVAVDLPIPGAGLPPRVRRKAPNALRAVYVARIARNKNLSEALEILAGMELPIEFDIYGPIEDKAYWNECREIIGRSKSAAIRHRGLLKPDAVVAAFAEYDLLLFPSLGENFGHVILEALVAGCPVLISDRTPWRDLEREQVGWAFPLGDPEAYQKVLRDCFRMDGDAFQALVARARVYAQGHLRAEAAEASNLGLFDRGAAIRKQETMA